MYVIMCEGGGVGWEWGQWVGGFLHDPLEDKNIVVVAKDTDVLTLLMTGFAQLFPSQLWVMKYDINKYASIKLYEYYGPSVCANISKYHALKGCDTTSYFFNLLWIMERNLYRNL